MVESLSFKIDGEWLTDLARTWFWDEDRPYEVCEELLGSCIETDDDSLKRGIIYAILEGRKKFTGINEFTLVDDNVNVRPITDKLAKYERNMRIAALREKLEYNFSSYVDKWSTMKSLHEDVFKTEKRPYRYTEWVAYLTTVNNCGNTEEIFGWEDRPGKCGLWLYERPELIYELTKPINGGLGITSETVAEDFWHKVYEYCKDKPEFSDRNARYLAYLRRKEEFEQLIAGVEIDIDEEDTEEEPKRLTKEWWEYKDKHDKDDNHNYRVKPDDIENWEGLIAPNGDFYSCSFGGHNMRAYWLITYFGDEFASKKDANGEPVLKDLKFDNALDKLLACGWCATRYLYVRGHYFDLPTYPKQPTKAQVDRIYDAIIKHEVKDIDTSALFH